MVVIAGILDDSKYIILLLAKIVKNPKMKTERHPGVLLFEQTGYDDYNGKDFTEKYATDKKFKTQPSQTRAVLNFISKYTPETTASFLEVANYSVQFTKYDWTINDKSKK